MTTATQERNETQHDPASEWGGCSECGKCGTYLNIHKEHWFRCDEHKTKWCVGTNLFTSWRNESEEEWRTNAKLLEDYREVEPRYPWQIDRRSEPGKGEKVALYWLGRDQSCTSCDQDGRSWKASAGEDFAKSECSIVVKAKSQVSRFELACRLRRLAELVETDGLRMPVLVDENAPFEDDVAQ